jgi:hypothetical protein
MTAVRWRVSFFFIRAEHIVGSANDRPYGAVARLTAVGRDRAKAWRIQTLRETVYRQEPKSHRIFVIFSHSACGFSFLPHGVGNGFTDNLIQMQLQENVSNKNISYAIPRW